MEDDVHIDRITCNSLEVIYIVGRSVNRGGAIGSASVIPCTEILLVTPRVGLKGIPSRQITYIEVVGLQHFAYVMQNTGLCNEVIVLCGSEAIVRRLLTVIVIIEDYGAREVTLRNLVFDIGLVVYFLCGGRYHTRPVAYHRGIVGIIRIECHFCPAGEVLNIYSLLHQSRIGNLQGIGSVGPSEGIVSGLIHIES